MCAAAAAAAARVEETGGEILAAREEGENKTLDIKFFHHPNIFLLPHLDIGTSVIKTLFDSFILWI